MTPATVNLAVIKITVHHRATKQLPLGAGANPDTTRVLSQSYSK